MSTPADSPYEHLLASIDDSDHKCDEPRPVRSVLIGPDGLEHVLESASSDLEHNRFYWDACYDRSASSF